MKPPQGPAGFRRFCRLRCGADVHPRTRAVLLCQGELGQMFGACPVLKWVWVSDLAFIFYEWERETCSLRGIQHQPASLTNWKSQRLFVLSDSSRRLTGERTRTTSILCEKIANCCRCSWQITVHLNAAGLMLIHQRSWRSHVGFTGTSRTICRFSSGKHRQVAVEICSLYKHTHCFLCISYRARVTAV